MAIKGARDVIRDTVDEASLGAFEAQCETVDELLGVLERENDPDSAFTLAIAWASAVLSLARIECALLSSVLPEYQDDMEQVNAKVKELVQQRTEAENVMFELRGSSGDVQPLSMKRDPARIAAKADAKQHRDKVYAETLRELVPLQREQAPISHTIGAIDRTIRALLHFTDTAFPVPTRKSRSPMGRANEDRSADPLAAFAEKYVANMGRRDKEKRAFEAQLERTRIADQRPARDWDKLHKEDLARRAEHIS